MLKSIAEGHFLMKPHKEGTTLTLVLGECQPKTFKRFVAQLT
jgi:hypothetical protein